MLTNSIHPSVGCCGGVLKKATNRSSTFVADGRLLQCVPLRH
jgi:hypothetical protein